MTSPERIMALCDAVRYIARRRIEGAIVECGVWRGGSMMAAALTLISERDTTRELYLYDTFAGMTTPDERDVTFRGERASTKMDRIGRDDAGRAKWCAARLKEVEENLERTGYSRERCHFIEGPVDQTLPDITPGPISLLRLDTDFYESTRHELEHLFPLIVEGGVLIVDDYGHWVGARRAVDEYLDRNGIVLLLSRIDYTGRIAVVTNDSA